MAKDEYARAEPDPVMRTLRAKPAGPYYEDIRFDDYLSKLDNQFESMLTTYARLYRHYLQAPPHSNSQVYLKAQLALQAAMICKHYEYGYDVLNTVYPNWLPSNYDTSFIAEVQFFINKLPLAQTQDFGITPDFIERIKAVIKRHRVVWPTAEP